MTILFAAAAIIPICPESIVTVQNASTSKKELKNIKNITKVWIKTHGVLRD